MLKVQEIFYLSRHLSFERHSEELFSMGLGEGLENSYLLLIQSYIVKMMVGAATINSSTTALTISLPNKTGR